MAIADKVKKIIRSRALLFKLIVTILVFICIPLLAMQIFVIGESTDEFRKSNEEYYTSILQSSAQTFASREQILSNTAFRISMNDAIQKPVHEDPPQLADMYAAEALLGYGEEILHMNNVGIFYLKTENKHAKEKAYILIGGHNYTLRTYCEKMETTEEDIQALATFLKDARTMEYFITSDGSTLYAAQGVFLTSIKNGVDAVVFFEMDAASLEESYRTAVSAQASFAVLNDQGKFLVRGENFREQIGENTVKNVLSSKETTFTVGDNGELLLYRYTDPETQYTYLLSVDKGEAQGKVIAFAERVLMATGIAVLVVMASLLITIYINYQPINKLLKKYTSAEEREVYSEIERLDSALFRLDKERSSQKDLLTEFILGDLIFDNTVKPELLSQYFPPEHYRSCVVFAVQGTTLNTVQSKLLAEKLERATGCSCYITSAPGHPLMAIACLSKTAICEENLHSCVIKTVEDTLAVACPISMGEVVTDIHDLRVSYRTAVSVYVETAYVEPGAAGGELAQKLQALSQSVYLGDEAESLAHLEDVRKFLSEHTPGEGRMRYYGFKLINAYLSGVNSGKAQLSDKEIELLLSYTSMDHLFKLLRESICQVCSQVADMEHSMDLQMQQKLLQYVDENFQKSELCLTAAADHIGTSIYAVSRLFKEITGKGFKDYVTEKRLECGHKLLCTTNLSIAEISAAAGFDNANYFSTIFKQKYGMPPTKYRNEHKEK